MESATNDLASDRRILRSGRGVVRDIAIVVVGVLIALAADAWWQGLEEQRREQHYLRALEADLAGAKDALVEIRRETVASQEDIEAFMQVLEGDGPIPEGLEQVPFYLPLVDLPMGTMDALLSTGDLRLLRDAQLRQVITSEHARMAAVRRRFDVIADTDYRNYEAYVISATDLRLAGGLTGVPPGALPVSMLRGRPEIIGRYSVLARMLNNQLAMLGHFEDSLAALEEALASGLTG